MAQQQNAAEVHPDELYPPNKRYDLMDANKKVDLENEDGSKYRLKFMLDKKELSLTLDDLRTIFHLPQVNDNNHNSFVPPPSFSDMVPFYKQQLGFTMELKTSSSFKTIGLLQLWTPSAPRSPTHKMDTLESSAPKQSTTIHFRLLEKRSTRLTPLAPVPTIDKADEMILQDTLQVSLAEHKSIEELEARENVELVNKHLASEEIEKMIPDTRLEPRSNKKSLEVEITNDKEVEITNVVIPVNVNEEEDEITDEVTHTNLVSSDIEKFQELTELQERYTYLFEHLKERFLLRKSFDTLADHIQEVMVESLLTMVDTHIKEQVKKQVPEQVRDQVPVYVAEGLIMERQKTKEEMERMIDKG
ncbi:hypothetical protein Tco_0848969 [Tanacetum coccineum]